MEDDEAKSNARFTNKLENFNMAITEKRPAMSHIFHNNARPHVSYLTRAKLLDLNWDVLIHPSYSPHLVP